MKTANSALLIAAGILLLWIVTSGKTKNLSASWNALIGNFGSSSGGNAPSLSSALGSAASVAPSITGTNILSGNPSLSGVPSTISDTALG